MAIDAGRSNVSQARNKKSREQQLIARIRAEEYLLDVKPPEELRPGIDSLRRNLDRTLTLLSTELYSAESHFILELIQNADDNSYAPSLVASLSFNAQGNALTVRNNETGFTEENVRALCRVGQSSKTAPTGYIGEKGIGFKSVFTVSSAPEIHSNGYHFRFNRSDPGYLLGFVVPEWYPPKRPVSAKGTTIVLPTRRGDDFDRTLLKGIDAHLLLFLNKIRKLELKIADVTTRHVRTDQGEYTTLETTTKPRGGATTKLQRRFLLVDHHVRVDDLDECRRSGATASKITLALPVSAADGGAEPDVRSQVCAFLPVRDYGFRFAIHADFLLSSSRESILTSSPWNLRLRDELGAAFLEAVERVKNAGNLALSYLLFAPREGEIADSFFEPVGQDILARLANTQCFLDSEGTWRRPQEVLFAGPEFKALFPPPVLTELFGLHYFHPSFSCDLELAHKLGCVRWSYKIFVEVFSRCGAWFMEQRCEWKARYLAFLAEQNHEHLVSTGLGRMPCIPSSQGTLAVPDDGNLFFPLHGNDVYGFEHELLIVEPEFLALAKSLSSKVLPLLTRLGVKAAKPHDVITGYILPLHAGEDWKKSTHKALIGHVRFVKEKLSDYLSAAKATGQTELDARSCLQRTLYLGTKDHAKAWIFAHASDLYLCEELAPDFGIETALGGTLARDKVLSACYLPSAQARRTETLAGWRRFFVELGVEVFPRAEKYLGGWRASQELAAVLSSDGPEVRRAALFWLDSNWKWFVDSNGLPSHISHTQLAETLRAMKVPTRAGGFVSASDVFAPVPELLRVFGEDLPVLERQLENRDFARVAGISCAADTTACLKRLRHLKSHGIAPGVDVGRIYRCLEEHWQADHVRILSALRDESLVFVGWARNVPKWVGSDSLVWDSNGPYLDSVYACMSRVYPGLYSFFVEKLGVAKELCVQDLLAALPTLADQIPSPEERRVEAMRLYTLAARELDECRASDSEPAWMPLVADSPAFLVDRGPLVQVNEGVFVVDDAVLGKLYSEDPEVHLVWVAAAELPKLRRLFSVLGVRSLSQAVAREVLAADVRASDRDLTTRIRARAQALARVVYFRCPDAYTEALGARLEAIEVCFAEKILSYLTVNGVTKELEVDAGVRGTQVILRRGASAKLDRLAREVCVLACVPSELALELTRVLLAATDEDADEALSVAGIGDLPVMAPTIDDTLQTHEYAEEEYGAEDLVSRSGAATLNLQNELSEPEEQNTDEALGQCASPGATSRGPRSRRRAASQGRLLSYAEPPSHKDGAHDEETALIAAARTEVAKAAVRAVLTAESARWKSLQEMALNNKG